MTLNKPKIFRDIDNINASLGEKANQFIETISDGVISGLGVVAQVSPNMTVAVDTGVVNLPDGKRYSPTANSSLVITSADSTKNRTDLIYVNSSGIVSYLPGNPILGTAGTMTYTIATNASLGKIYTITTNAIANDTVTINGVAFTAVTSGATGNQFNVGIDTVITATNLTAALNANSTINSNYIATSNLNIITLLAKSVSSGEPTVATTTGTIAVTSASYTGDAIRINNILFTGVPSGAVANQFNIGVTTTDTATNLVVALNGNSSINSLYNATSSGNVVTLTEKNKGNGNTPSEAIKAGTISITNGVATVSSWGAIPPTVPGGGMALANIMVGYFTSVISSTNIIDVRERNNLSYTGAKVAYCIDCPNNTNDVTSSINSIITGAVAKGYSKFIIKKGTYYICNLNLPSNVEVYGENGTIFKTHNSASQYSDIVRITSQQNIVIDNIAFDGNKENIIKSMGIRCLHIVNSSNIRVSNCSFYNNASENILSEGVFYSTFEKNSFKSSDVAILFMNTPSTNITVRNNDIDGTNGTSEGISLYSMGLNVKHDTFHIYENRILNKVNSCGIFLIQANNIECYDNYTYNCGGGITSYPFQGGTTQNSWNTTNVNIYNNVIVNSVYDGIAIKYSDTIKIFNNTILNSAGHGILLYYSNNVSLNDNKLLSSSTSQPIEMDCCNNINVINNSINSPNATDSLIWISGGAGSFSNNVLLIGNTLLPLTLIGIKTHYNYTSNITVINNTCLLGLNTYNSLILDNTVISSTKTSITVGSNWGFNVDANINFVEVTAGSGVTEIHGINTSQNLVGRAITIRFKSAFTIYDHTGYSGSNIQLTTGTSLTTAVNQIIRFVYDGQYWQQL